jgi:molybdate transport system substrate-binding protein
VPKSCHAALAFALVLAPAARANELLVFAAASLAEVLPEIAAEWQRAGGARVAFSFDGTPTLARQIEAGAAADLFVAADAATVDRLAAAGHLDASTRRELASNRLVVVVADGDRAPLRTLDDLAGPRVAALALAEPESVPAGIYARVALERAGLWARVRAKSIPTASVRAALAAVEAGNADAALVFATDARRARRARVAFELPPEATPRIAYAAAVPRAARNAGAARELLAFLASERAAPSFRRHGFLAPPAAPP